MEKDKKPPAPKPPPYSNPFPAVTMAELEKEGESEVKFDQKLENYEKLVKKK